MEQSDRFYTRFLGIYYGLWFRHTWAKIGNIPSMLFTINTWVLMVISTTGFRPQTFTDWLNILFVTLLVALFIFVSFTFFGKWDIGRKGTRKQTLMEDFENNPYGLILQDINFDTLKKLCIANNVTMSKEVDETHRWIKKARLKLGV